MRKFFARLTVLFIAMLAVSIGFSSAMAAQTAAPKQTATPQQTASAQTATPTPPSTQPDPLPLKAIMQAYGDVLFGGHVYIQCNTYDNITVEAKLPSKIMQWYGYEFETPLKFTAFSVTDLDADGLPEVILQLSDDFGFELLRYESGVVYGFPFVYRAMEDVTLEGDIFGDSGAFDSSWYKIRFHENQYEEIETCRMQMGDTGNIQYFIGGKEVSQSDYKAFCDGFTAKKRPAWVEYTKKNFQAVVSRFE